MKPSDTELMKVAGNEVGTETWMAKYSRQHSSKRKYKKVVDMPKYLFV